MNRYLGIAALTLGLLLPSITLAQTWSITGAIGSGGGGTCDGICYIGDVILYSINSILVPVLFALAFIVFVYGVARAYIFSQGDPESVAQGHKFVLWGVIGFAIMISLWGLVNIVAETFNLTEELEADLPTSPI